MKKNIIIILLFTSVVFPLDAQILSHNRESKSGVAIWSELNNYPGYNSTAYQWKIKTVTATASELDSLGNSKLWDFHIISFDTNGYLISEIDDHKRQVTYDYSPNSRSPWELCYTRSSRGGGPILSFEGPAQTIILTWIGINGNSYLGKRTMVGEINSFTTFFEYSRTGLIERQIGFVHKAGITPDSVNLDLVYPKEIINYEYEYY